MLQIAVNTYWGLWQRLLFVLKIYFSFLSIVINLLVFNWWLPRMKIRNPSIHLGPLGNLGKGNHKAKRNKMESPWVPNTVEWHTTPSLTYCGLLEHWREITFCLVSYCYLGVLKLFAAESNSKYYKLSFSVIGSLLMLYLF